MKDLNQNYQTWNNIHVLNSYNFGQIIGTKMIDLTQIDKSWTLFLDRDGVINHEKHQDYIHTWDEFIFYNGVKDAIKKFSKKFNRVIIVTNQKGVGKGLTKLEDLEFINKNLTHEIKMSGGKIDKIYYCPDLEDSSPNRKPNPGMGIQAIKEFPDIDPAKTIMVGNTMSDMEFGRNLGFKTVFLPTTRPDIDVNDNRIDATYKTLPDFAKAL